MHAVLAEDVGNGPCRDVGRFRWLSYSTIVLTNTHGVSSQKWLMWSVLGFFFWGGETEFASDCTHQNGLTGL
jgi:hypothetical protein